MMLRVGSASDAASDSVPSSHMPYHEIESMGPNGRPLGLARFRSLAWVAGGFLDFESFAGGLAPLPAFLEWPRVRGPGPTESDPCESTLFFMEPCLELAVSHWPDGLTLIQAR